MGRFYEAIKLILDVVAFFTGTYFHEPIIRRMRAFPQYRASWVSNSWLVALPDNGIWADFTSTITGAPIGRDTCQRKAGRCRSYRTLRERQWEWRGCDDKQDTSIPKSAHPSPPR